MKMKSLHILNLFSVLVIFVSPCVAAADKAEKSIDSKPPSVFATIGKEAISWQDLNVAYNQAAQKKFYHGSPADHVIAALQREVADKLVADTLVLNEANRRKIKPDTDVVNQELESIEKRRAGDAQWLEARGRVLPVLTRQIENETKVKKLTAQVRNVTPPTSVQVRAYYTNHPEKFTAPVEQRVSIILLTVDPSSGNEVWEQAAADASVLLERIRKGESFAEMAKLYSKDAETVDQGGDMGYLHAGMLADTSQKAVDAIQVGEITKPVRLLQGVALFQLTSRNPALLSSFESVADRAKDLWLADASDKAWESFMDNLRKKTPMNIDESKFLPLAKTEVRPSSSAENAPSSN